MFVLWTAMTYIKNNIKNNTYKHIFQKCTFF